MEGLVAHLYPALAWSVCAPGHLLWTGRALQAEFEKWRGWSCASVSGPCMERLCPWPSWISARTRSHSEKGPERPLGSPDHGCDGETVSPSPQIQLADLGRYSSNIPRLRQGSALDIPSAGPSALILCNLWFDARFVAATLCQHSPSNPRQLIGERGCQDVMV